MTQFARAILANEIRMRFFKTFGKDGWRCYLQIPAKYAQDDAPLLPPDAN